MAARITWKDMSRSAAVVRVLASTGEPMNRTEIASVLATKGREDGTPEDVYKVIGALLKSGKVVAVSRGVYAASADQS